jgi:hypothetical protein
MNRLNRRQQRQLRLRYRVAVVQEKVFHCHVMNGIMGRKEIE